MINAGFVTSAEGAATLAAMTDRAIQFAGFQVAEPNPPEQPDPGDTIPDDENTEVPEPPDPEEE